MSRATTKQYIVRRLTFTEWGPTDRQYEKDLGLHLVLPDDPEGKRERIPLKGLPLDARENDGVQVTLTPAAVHIEIVSRVVTERRPIVPQEDE